MNLEPFLGHSDPVVADATKRTKFLTDQYTIGKFGPVGSDEAKGELRELLADQLDYARLSAAIDDNDRKVNVQKALIALMEVVALAMALKP